MIFVYWLEDHPEYASRVEVIFRAMLARKDTLCASHLCLGEVLVGPKRKQNNELVEKIEQFFDSGLVQLLPFDRRAAGEFARLRAEMNVSAADAIHLACAGAGGVDLFLTHDKGLHKMQVQGIQFIAGLDVNVY